MPSGERIRQILQATDKFEARDELNCGACGYTTCREHAVAGLADMAGSFAGSMFGPHPIAADVARYLMGLGFKGGARPESFDWKWKVENNQDSAWIGDVNAGLQFTLKDDKYVRPLNTNFYTLKPLVMPASWFNGGKGGCRLAEKDASTYLVSCYSGARTIAQGETLHYNFRLLLTPFKPLDTAARILSRGIGSRPSSASRRLVTVTKSGAVSSRVPSRSNKTVLKLCILQY